LRSTLDLARRSQLHFQNLKQRVYNEALPLIDEISLRSSRPETGA
jgi:hypothetical protein